MELQTDGGVRVEIHAADATCGRSLGFAPVAFRTAHTVMCKAGAVQQPADVLGAPAWLLSWELMQVEGACAWHAAGSEHMQVVLILYMERNPTDQVASVKSDPRYSSCARCAFWTGGAVPCRLARGGPSLGIPCATLNTEVGELS